MTIEEMKAKKIELGLTSEMIAQASGIPVSTLQKLFSGKTRAPRKQTIEAIEKVFREEEERKERPYSVFSSGSGQTADTVRESSAACTAPQKPGKYTLEDYYALPEERRVELIDGMFYDMTPPTRRHQMILGDLHLLFRECADRHGLPCEVYLAPCDVRLDRDDYTMVQPDLMVICDDDDEEIRRIEGAPDLVVEILSLSTRSKDMILKLYKYKNAGVREYWIVDPKFKTVTVHNFEKEEYYPERYGFEDKIPVGISGGECVIDFSVVGRRLSARGW